VLLFVSDVHLGRFDAAAERATEAALVACLEAHAARAAHLYLLGDVFDCYLEHRHLVPKGFVRFQALLARWTDAGVPVTYLVGNHDPWHRAYFETELGVRVRFDALDVRHAGARLHLAHGDGVDRPGSLYARLRPLLRHPLAAWAYRTFLPGDAGFALARRVSRARHHEGTDPRVVQGLRAYARRRLARADAVVLGHSHAPRLHAWRDGAYLNLGAWYQRRTFGRLLPAPDGGGPARLQLARWNGTRAAVIRAADVPARPR
jgi:UDP-2,3-diacylglucosamine hydrolase